MTQILHLTQDEPVIHIKAYGGIQIEGIEQPEVQCDIGAPQLATLVEEDGHVYVTVNASCRLRVPSASAIEIERGMGSVKVANIKKHIQIEKVLGNLVFFDIHSATVNKVGGNFSVRRTEGPVEIEKVAGNLVVEDVASFQCEKVGGNCKVRNVAGDFSLEKAGGKFMAEGIGGVISVSKVGASFVARDLKLTSDLKAGSRIKLENVTLPEDLSLRAGSDIHLVLREGAADMAFMIRSGAHKIRIKTELDDLDLRDGSYDYQMGDDRVSHSLSAGGAVSITDKIEDGEDIVGDLSDQFTFEESPFSELIQERVDSATRKAEAKIRTAEIRLEQIRERVEKHRGFNIDVDLGESAPREKTQTAGQPVPPISRPAGKKGATDEERLMILKMLEDNKITVDEAETLFKALED